MTTINRYQRLADIAQACESRSVARLPKLLQESERAIRKELRRASLKDLQTLSIAELRTNDSLLTSTHRSAEKIRNILIPYYLRLSESQDEQENCNLCQQLVGLELYAGALNGAPRLPARRAANPELIHIAAQPIVPGQVEEVADAPVGVVAEPAVDNQVAVELVVNDQVIEVAVVPAAQPVDQAEIIQVVPGRPAVRSASARATMSQRVGKVLSNIWASLKSFGTMLANAISWLIGRRRA